MGETSKHQPLGGAAGAQTTKQFAIASVPAVETIFSFLRKSTDLDRVCRNMRPKLRNTEKLEFSLVDVDLGAVLSSVKQIIDTSGFSGWRHRDGESRTYGGFSLAFNPDHQDRFDPHVSTIGTPKNLKSEFFWSKTERHDELKHSYFDTYGFRKRTPASRHGALGALIDRFPRSLVRSRVGIISGGNVDPSDASYQQKDGWHRDEPVFENLRINIPLQTDENFLFQMEDSEPYHLPVGSAYSWDTNRPHRVFARAQTDLLRIHLVLGFSPWFDYLEDTDSWCPNAFFGRVHPFDMLADGYFGRHLRLRPQRLT